VTERQAAAGSGAGSLGGGLGAAQGDPFGNFVPNGPIGLGAATAPGTGASVALAADEGEDLELPQMTAQIYDSIFKPAQVPSYGPESRGPAMRQEDITAVGGKRGELVRLAKSFVGTPYVWGGTDPRNGFDCSGFIQYVYRKMGIELPRVSYQQANAGQRIKLKDLQPGDLVAWDNSSRNNGADHIAIYLGGGLIAESPRPGVPNRIRKMGRMEGAWGVRVL